MTTPASKSNVMPLPCLAVSKEGAEVGPLVRTIGAPGHSPTRGNRQVRAHTHNHKQTHTHTLSLSLLHLTVREGNLLVVVHVFAA